MADLIRFNVGLRNGQSELYQYIEKNKGDLKGNLGAEVARLAEIGLIFIQTGRNGEQPGQTYRSDSVIGGIDNSKQISDFTEDDQKENPSEDVSGSDEFMNAVGEGLFA